MDARRALTQLTAALLIAVQVVNAVPALAAPAPVRPAPSADSSAKLVSRAQDLYRDARYDEAVGLLSGPVLRKELAGDELREARIVLARCYVKKGMLPRAKEHFGAVLAADPAYVLDASHADAEEMAVWNQLKGVPAVQPATPPGAPATEGKPAEPKPPASEPTLHKPSDESSDGSGSKPGWLMRNKYLAIAVVAGGGLIAGLAGGGGGGGGSTPPGPQPLPGFPAPPGGH